jgi:N-sulfoglucosamine sulfohydrolase
LHHHRQLLGGYLMKTNDPRVTGNGDIFETYPRLRGAIRSFPEPVK